MNQRKINSWLITKEIFFKSQPRSAFQYSRSPEFNFKLDGFDLAYAKTHILTRGVLGGAPKTPVPTQFNMRTTFWGPLQQTPAYAFLMSAKP